ncbi:c-type cytochrome [Chitinimonas koreensis]|uniref:c-type cytochrome n=1 Tax=Chitinimonas koreensis TaxID=356302 RepID=UPI0004013ED2|nr:c-type cytochrome [Chitinimonas koreensis]QNM96566.1 c-type cytochrome [Chitinimonas koreensis]
MKRLLAAALLCAPLLAQAAPDGLALAAKYNCLACHQVDKKVVGPAYKDVAAKYRNDKTAEAKLAAKVKQGTVGAWGQIPMPAQQIGDADLKLIVQWILAQK